MSEVSLLPEVQEVLLSPLHHEGANTQIKKLSLGKRLGKMRTFGELDLEEFDLTQKCFVHRQFWQNY